MSGAQQLESVIVVMLENRVFDHLFGFLEPGDPSFAGVGDGVSNPLDPANSGSERVPAVIEQKLHLRVDPDHSHEAVMTQLGLIGTRTEPTNDGFVASYEAKAMGQGPGPAKARRARRIVLSVAGAIARPWCCCSSAGGSGRSAWRWWRPSSPSKASAARG